MPLAGRMKLRTFLLLGGGLAVLGLGGSAAAFVAFGLPAIEEAANQRVEQKRQQLMEKVEERKRELSELRDAQRQPQPVVPDPNPGNEVQALIGEAIGQKTAEPDLTSWPNERPIDNHVTQYLGKPLGSSKRKDVTSGRPYKVNVYQDSGFSTANRAKVDLDRDDQWDEKWTWADGELSRKIAPKDNEVYSVEQVWKDRAWVDR